MIVLSRNIAKRILFDVRDPSPHAAKVELAGSLTRLQGHQ